MSAELRFEEWWNRIMAKVEEESDRVSLAQQKDVYRRLLRGRHETGRWELRDEPDYDAPMWRVWQTERRVPSPLYNTITPQQVAANFYGSKTNFGDDNTINFSTNVNTIGGTFMERRTVIAQRLAALEKELAALARFPDDNFPTGTVISWTIRGRSNRTGEEQDFTYAACKGGLDDERNWYLTSTVNTRRVMSYEDLCAFVGDSAVYIMVKGDAIIPSKEDFERGDRLDEAPEDVKADGTVTVTK